MATGNFEFKHTYKPRAAEARCNGNGTASVTYYNKFGAVVGQEVLELDTKRPPYLLTYENDEYRLVVIKSVS